MQAVSEFDKTSNTTGSTKKAWWRSNGTSHKTTTGMILQLLSDTCPEIECIYDAKYLAEALVAAGVLLQPVQQQQQQQQQEQTHPQLHPSHWDDPDSVIYINMQST